MLKAVLPIGHRYYASFILDVETESWIKRIAFVYIASEQMFSFLT